MKYRLAIADRVAVQVKGKLPGDRAGAATNFNFTLDMERLDQAQVRAALASSESVEDFLIAKTRGWDGQRLVLGADNQPAPYNEEAFRALMGIPGMAPWILQAYMRDLGVQEKN